MNLHIACRVRLSKAKGRAREGRLHKGQKDKKKKREGYVKVGENEGKGGYWFTKLSYVCRVD